MIHKFKVKRHGRALLAEAGKNLPSWATPGNADVKKDLTTGGAELPAGSDPGVTHLIGGGQMAYMSTSA